MCIFSDNTVCLYLKVFIICHVCYFASLFFNIRRLQPDENNFCIPLFVFSMYIRIEYKNINVVHGIYQNMLNRCLFLVEISFLPYFLSFIRLFIYVVFNIKSLFKCIYLIFRTKICYHIYIYVCVYLYILF